MPCMRTFNEVVAQMCIVLKFQGSFFMRYKLTKAIKTIIFNLTLMLFTALGNLGSVLSSQGRYIEAKEALQLALKYRPNMADVHYNL